jgi:hypothetical protein
LRPARLDVGSPAMSIGVFQPRSPSPLERASMNGASHRKEIESREPEGPQDSVGTLKLAAAGATGVGLREHCAFRLAEAVADAAFGEGEDEGADGGVVVVVEDRVGAGADLFAALGLAEFVDERGE